MPADDDLRRHATRAIEQLHELIGVVKQLFSQLGYADAASITQNQAALQQRYLAATSGLRATLAQCFSLLLLSEEAERQGTGAGASDAPMAEASEPPPPEGGEALASRCAALQAELCGRNEAVKQLIDQLRQMLESMCMWESHRHQLERHRVAEGH